MCHPASIVAFLNYWPARPDEVWDVMGSVDLKRDLKMDGKHRFQLAKKEQKKKWAGKRVAVVAESDGQTNIYPGTKNRKTFSSRCQRNQKSNLIVYPVNEMEENADNSPASYCLDDGTLWLESEAFHHYSITVFCGRQSDCVLPSFLLAKFASTSKTKRVQERQERSGASQDQ